VLARGRFRSEEEAGFVPTDAPLRVAADGSGWVPVVARALPLVFSVDVRPFKVGRDEVDGAALAVCGLAVPPSSPSRTSKCASVAASRDAAAVACESASRIAPFTIALLALSRC